MTIEAVVKLQKVLRTMPQLDIITRHAFADGMYARTIWLPRNGTLVGRVSRREHFFFVVSGEMTIWSNDSAMRFKGPHLVVSPPGTKRAGFAHDPSIVMTVHRVSEKALESDLGAVEDDIAEPDEDSMYLPGNVPKELIE